MDTDTPTLQARKSRAMQVTLATMLAMHGFGRHAPPARLFLRKEEQTRKKVAAEAKRARRAARNLQLTGGELQFKEKVHTT